jgi:hypothetical protein
MRRVAPLLLRSALNPSNQRTLRGPAPRQIARSSTCNAVKWNSSRSGGTESIEYVGGQGVPESFVGQSFEFTVKVDGDKMTKVGTIQLNGQDYKIDERWERYKP